MGHTPRSSGRSSARGRLLRPDAGTSVNPIRGILNKLRWTGQRGSIVYVNRGSPGDLAEISTEELAEIGHGGFTTKSGAYIPYHRVVEIRDGEGKVLLKRRR
ncbi:hypothetical protein B7L68_05985 [Thermoproteus sp. CP80]|nr:hypothetical protein B7L68_05985 [Thermoproteus sp. CP80]